MNNGRRLRRSIHIRHGRPKTKRGLHNFQSTTIRLSYTRRYMLWSKDSWNLDGCRKGLTSCSKPKELFLQSKEALQENEPDRREIARARREIQGAAPQRTPLHQTIAQELGKKMR